MLTGVLSAPGQSVAGAQVMTSVHPFLATTKQFKGSGKGQVVSTAPRPNGGLETISSLSGTVSQLGSFTGRLTLDFASDRLHFTGQAVLVGATSKTDQIRLQVVGSNSTPKRMTTFVASFKILGGTGRFAHATGSGALSGVANAVTGAASFSISGTVTS
jgi:hypothetical protein